MVFQKGNDPNRYTGGAKPGHAPTNPNGHMPGLEKAHATPGAFAYRFDQPLGQQNRAKGGRQAKNKERTCMEAIQNQTEPDERKLVQRGFPVGMVRRLMALHVVSQDPEHKDFLHAQRLVREILTTLKKQPGEDESDPSAPTSGDTITVFEGRIDVPMPGAAEPE